MAQIKIAVLRGGPSSEHEVSLSSGEFFINTLSENKKYLPVDILIRKDGEWTLNSVPVLPEKALRMSDVALIALHGEYGEDGKVQRILENYHIPFTGSSSHASFLGMNKVLSRGAFEQNGLLIPKGIVLDTDDDPEESAQIILSRLAPNWVIKPVVGGSSLGIKIAKTFKDLVESIKHAFGYSKKVLVEEMIMGKEFTCGVIENFRGEDYYTLPAIEIIPHPSRSFFDYEAKYCGLSTEICPARITNHLKKELAFSATLAHKSIGARHYSRTDFMVDQRGNVYTLEINTLPGMTETSLLPKSLLAVGAERGYFLDHLISLALK